MKRDMDQLQQIAGQFDRRAHTYPGLGMMLFVFDDIERVPGQTNVAIVLRGIKVKDAVRMLREKADEIERSTKEQRDSLLVGPQGQVLKSSNLKS